MKLFTFTQKSKSKMIYAFEITLPLFYKKLFIRHIKYNCNPNP